MKSQIISPDDYYVMIKHALHMNETKDFSHKYATSVDTTDYYYYYCQSFTVYGNMLQPKFQSSSGKIFYIK